MTQFWFSFMKARGTALVLTSLTLAPLAMAQTSNPSPLNQPARPGTANPTTVDPSQNPAQNRVGDQFKRNQNANYGTRNKKPQQPNIFQKGVNTSGKPEQEKAGETDTESK